MVQPTDLDADVLTPRLECPRLPADHATCFVGNELRLSGWALGATGPASVAVEIDGQAVPVVTGVESRDAVEARPDIAQAERAGFAIRIDTSEWEGGQRQIRIIARDNAGGETCRHGILDVLPYRIAPSMLRTMIADIAGGRPVLACDQPTLDGSYEVGSSLAVQGWAYVPSGIEAVLITLDGRWRKPAEYGLKRADLIEKLHPDAGDAGFRLDVDISDEEEGEHWLTVVAVTRDGQAVGSEGPIRTRHRWWPRSRSLDADGSSAIPERCMPEELRGHLNDAEHQARYRWAAQLARDAEVLDAACGVGNGAAILAEEGARRVVGIDRDAEAILNARARAGEVAEFMLGDLRALPFEEGSFDVIVCFETIEQVIERDTVLDELGRVLRQDGILLISSPNRETFTLGNPHHRHEYTPDELRAALGRRFANARLHGQHAHLASLLAGDEVFAVEDGHAPLSVEVRKLGATPAELYTVAAASNAELPVLDDIVTLGGVFDVRQLLEYAWAWEDRAIAAEADAAANRTEAEMAKFAYQRTGEARKRAEESERALQRAQARLDALSASKSWRLTAPLRQAADVVRRRRPQ
ncbi:MAG TPA: class I SAM-dependent methyltransferase [Thermoleophilaceae bacterium]|nr:class I SAM-dependent methyltransferase [Thermoleophilaceae bacterium]